MKEPSRCEYVSLPPSLLPPPSSLSYLLACIYVNTHCHIKFSCLTLSLSWQICSSDVDPYPLPRRKAWGIFYLMSSQFSLLLFFLVLLKCENWSDRNLSVNLNQCTMNNCKVAMMSCKLGAAIGKCSRYCIKKWPSKAIRVYLWWWDAVISSSIGPKQCIKASTWCSLCMSSIGLY